MVRHPDIDLVVTCVRVPHHREMVLASIEAGKDIFCEWPLGRSTAEAEEMLHAAEAMGTRHMVGLQGQVAPAIARIRDLVAEGAIGRVVSATLISSLALWGPELPAEEAFRVDRSNGATGLTITGGHSLDALCFCLGNFRELSAVVSTQHGRTKLIGTATTLDVTSPDQALICGTLQSGAVVSLHIKADIANPTGILFEINGTEGDLIAASRQPVERNAVGLQRADLRLFFADRREGAGYEEVEVPQAYRLVPDDVPAGSPFSTAQLYSCLAKSILEGKPAKPNFRTAVNCHHLIDAVQRSSDTGMRQTVSC
jgi:predicted dehydrogenase